MERDPWNRPCLSDADLAPDVRRSLLAAIEDEHDDVARDVWIHRFDWQADGAYEVAYTWTFETDPKTRLYERRVVDGRRGSHREVHWV